MSASILKTTAVSISGPDDTLLDLDAMLLMASRRKGGLTLVSEADPAAYLSFTLNSDFTIRVKEKLLDSGMSDYATFQRADTGSGWACTSDTGVGFEYFGVRNNVGKARST